MATMARKPTDEETRRVLKKALATVKEAKAAGIRKPENLEKSQAAAREVIDILLRKFPEIPALNRQKFKKIKGGKSDD